MITLASIVHDPKAKLLLSFIDYTDSLKSLYNQMCFVITDETDKVLINHLDSIGQIQVKPKVGLGAPRRDSLSMATGETIHYCDSDRVLYWLRHYPTELAYTLDYIQHYDFTILERTKRAFYTHPKFQRDTEAEASQIASSHFNRPTDFLTGSRGLSQKARSAILEYSKAMGAGTDVEWPLIAKKNNLSIGYLLCEGLEYESDYFDIKRENRAEIINRMDNLREILEVA